ncbi:MAG TPA: hypothetical protein DDY78_00745 [Planctomycetales bacterium]|jgi:hypothetical protein|nr:hypothetical protein [Planctomycetales bacterium]
MSRLSRIGLAVVVAITCAAEAPAARAGLVTPDSIASPVISWSASGPAIFGGPVAVNGIVTDQYQGLGLLFPAQTVGEPNTTYSTAVIRLNNHDVFAGAYLARTPTGLVNYVSANAPAGVTAALVLPGTTTPDMADSVTVSFESTGPILGQLKAFDKNGRLLKTVTTQIGGVLDTPVELDVAGIQSIYATAYLPIIDPLPGFGYIAGRPDFYWGVSSIEWHEAPEPAGFVLGGLGMFALLGYAWRRRSMRVRLGVRGA